MVKFTRSEQAQVERIPNGFYTLRYQGVQETRTYDSKYPGGGTYNRVFIQLAVDEDDPSGWGGEEFRIWRSDDIGHPDTAALFAAVLGLEFLPENNADGTPFEIDEEAMMDRKFMGTVTVNDKGYNDVLAPTKYVNPQQRVRRLARDGQAQPEAGSEPPF